MPVDGQFLAAAGLRLDQSALTGEPHPVAPGYREQPREDPSAGAPSFVGGSVVAGSGLYTAVGPFMCSYTQPGQRLTLRGLVHLPIDGGGVPIASR